MSIKYDPTKMLNKIAPAKKIEKMVSSHLTLKKAALSFVSRIPHLSKKGVEAVALKTIKGYKERAKGDPDLKGELAKNPRQLIQRVQNEVVLQVAESIAVRYQGERYRWLPSDAGEPDPEHQLNYGKIFVIGEGEMPGDRFGCRCGMEILVEDSSLDLE